MGENPYIIWTMRRSGGTNFARTLARFSTFPKVQHEPFNPDRVFGEISTNWMKDGKIRALRQALAKSLESRPIIKHCMEVPGQIINQMIFNETRRLKYSHIILIRRDETARLFSLEVAKRLNAWSPTSAKSAFEKLQASAGTTKPRLDIANSIAHMTDCHLKQLWLESAFRRYSVPHKVVYHEDIFQSHEDAARILTDVLDFTGCTGNASNDELSEAVSSLLAGGQNSAQIAEHFQNFTRWRDALRIAWVATNVGRWNKATRRNNDAPIERHGQPS